jgi:acyl carrier protein
MDGGPPVDQVTAIFRDGLNVDVPAANADLIDGGFLDSLALVELVFRLEQQFEIELPLDELDIENFRTVEQIANVVESRRGPGGR